MVSEGPRSGPGPQDEPEPVCEACGQPVGTVIRRRKVLGVFVPVWGPGPCRNAHCEAYVDEADAPHSGAGKHFRSRRGRRSAALPGRRGRDAPVSDDDAEPDLPASQPGVDDDTK